ncbi:gamma-butyrobetaine dioxygenase-like [Brevipalpus obovatus]|uniref:gamma-butyrobetaine dioxygenase-like n=1 Tax=Brevipalpus obovatus TaxID=246614 RepID=UPI003D9DD3FF
MRSSSSLVSRFIRPYFVNNIRLSQSAVREESSVKTAQLGGEKKLLTVEWPNGHEESFHIAWLRDSCKCPKCVHPSTYQKLFNPATIDMDALSPLQISNNGESLSITWQENHSGEQHKSTYPLSWLLKLGGKFNSPITSNKDYPNDGIYQPIEMPKSVHWNADIICKLDIARDYQEIMQSDDHLECVLHDLCTFGISIVKNSPTEEGTVLRIADRIAYPRVTGYGTSFDVVASPDPLSHFSYSSQPLEPHTDLCYRERVPGTQLLHCIRDADSEGFSLFTDGFQCASLIRAQHPELFQALTQPVMFSFLDPERGRWYRERWPVIIVSPNGELKEVNLSVFSMRPPILPFDKLEQFYTAFKEFFLQAQSSVNQWKYHLSPGDIAIFNNRRIFHGRTGYDHVKSKRFLQGCYIDWDEVTAMYEKLRSSH